MPSSVSSRRSSRRTTPIRETPLRQSLPSRSRSASVTSSATVRPLPQRSITPHPPRQVRQRVQIRIPGHTSTESEILDTSPSQHSEHNSGEGGREPDPDADSLNEVVMAVDIRERGTVGCSYYVAREEKLYFMEDVKLGGPEVVDACKILFTSFEMLNDRRLVKTYFEPTVVLVSTRIDDAIIDRLDPDMRARGSTVDEQENQFALPYLLEVRPSPEFSYEGAKSKLVNLDLESESGPSIHFIVPGDVLADNGGARCREHLLRLASWVDIESRLTVGCAGAVLSYLQRRRAAGYLPGDEAQYSLFRISSIEMFSMKGFM